MNEAWKTKLIATVGIIILNSLHKSRIEVLMLLMLLCKLFDHNPINIPSNSLHKSRIEVLMLLVLLCMKCLIITQSI